MTTGQSKANDLADLFDFRASERAIERAWRLVFWEERSKF
jgi:hypothetical protein